jgi:hypothetical protein
MSQPMPNFREIKKDFSAVINKHSLENQSNTPDFIYAEFLAHCMIALTQAIKQRDDWYGIQLSPAMDKSKFPSPVQEETAPSGPAAPETDKQPALHECAFGITTSGPIPLLPPRKNHFEDVLDQITSIIGVAMGSASLCWNPRPTGVFNATECSKHLEVARLQIKELLKI